MELLIKAIDIRVEYNGRNILDIDEIEIYNFDRIGLIGANGVGKSTLLKVLLGKLSPTECEVTHLGKFAYIPQEEDEDFQEIKNYAIMGKLGVDQLAIETMSDGEGTRLKIAKALSDGAHAILADEPTNHLDYEGVDFLIGQFKYFTGALLIVSHDRYFLDEVINKVWELRDGKITEYWGNYSDYLNQKDEEYKCQVIKYEQYIKERNRLERASEIKHIQAQKLNRKTKGKINKEITQSGGRLAHQKTTGSKQKKLFNAAKSIDHKIEVLEDIKKPERVRIFRFHQNKALTLNNSYPIIGTKINKKFGDKVIFENATFNIPLGSKVALLGGNGIGKTTLLQMILNYEDGITIASKVKIGYIAQNSYKINHNKDIMTFMKEDCDYNVSEIRSILATIGFLQNDIYKTFSVLSGGEIIKLLITKMLLGKFNILLMDEPNNFLDLPSLQALEQLMIGYTGTILFVSHDKHLVDHVANVIYEIKDKKINLIKQV